MPLQAMKSYLNSKPPGPLDDEERVETLLVDAWDELEGSADGGMESYKLNGRMESLTWNPPTLSFQIERHGGTVNGSVYAEMQQWEIDCDRGIANYDRFKSHRRQVASKIPPLKVDPIAQEIANIIKSGIANDRLKWLSQTEAKVLISEIIPNNCCQQTLSGRRKRFYVALQREVAAAGWSKRVNSPVFEMKPPAPDSAD
jgi:hypothetical protein